MLTRGSAATVRRLQRGRGVCGRSLTVSADVHSTDIGLTALAEDFDDLLALLADILQFPPFAEEHVERLWRREAGAHPERDQDTGSIASQRFYAAPLRPRSCLRATGGYLERRRCNQPTCTIFTAALLAAAGRCLCPFRCGGRCPDYGSYRRALWRLVRPELLPHELPPLAPGRRAACFAPCPAKCERSHGRRAASPPRSRLLRRACNVHASASSA